MQTIAPSVPFPVFKSGGEPGTIDETFILMSTKARNKPDGSPCTWLKKSLALCKFVFIPQAGESDWVYVLESVDVFNKLLVGAGLDDLADKDDTRLRTLIHGQRNGYWRQYPK